MKQTSPKYLMLLALNFVFVCSVNAASPKLDPIKFTLSTNATHISLNEEFEIKITAEYLNVSSSVAYVLKDANFFRIKLIVPNGFVKTGGDYYDYTGTELTRSKPKVTYTVKGKFVAKAGSAIFELLRSHRSADNQSTFVAVGRLAFDPETAMVIEDKSNEQRIATDTVGLVPYMTMSQLKSEYMGTAQSVSITDPLRSGIFIYDPNDSASPNDDAMVIVTNSGRRYKRSFSGGLDVRWFGAIADFNTGSSAGTDNTSAFEKATDFAIANKIEKLLVMPGHYGLQKYIIRNVSIEGVGKVYFHALASSEASFFKLQPGVVSGIHLTNFQLLGTSANANQLGFDITASYTATDNSGGWWYSEIDDVVIKGFNGGAMKFDCNDPTISGSLKDIANQFLTFNNVRAFRMNATTRALSVNGQFGQVVFNNCQFDGAAENDKVNSINVELVSGTAGSPTDEVYSVDFNTCTFQNGDKGIRTRYARLVNFNGCHWENMARPLYLETNSVVNVDGGYFAASGNGSRITNATIDGCLAYVSASELSMDRCFKVGTVNYTIIGSSPTGIHYGDNNKFPANFLNLGIQTSVAADGSISVQGNSDRILINPTVLALKTINSNKGVNNEIILDPLGEITLDETGNIVIPGELTSLVFRANQLIKLVLRNNKWYVLNYNDSFLAFGTNSPEGNVAAKKGTIYIRNDGSDTTGWVFVKSREASPADKVGWIPLATRVSSVDFEVTDPEKGYILRSQSGKRYRITVEDPGILTTEEVE